MSKLKVLFLIILLSAGISGNASAATFTVNSVTDAVDANPGDGFCATAEGACTLRAAIQEANALPGEDTIILPEGIYNLTGVLDITDTAGVIIQGAGSASTIVDGNGIDTIFQIQPGGAADISGITIRGGNAVNDYGNSGGGIFNSGTLTLTGCTISNNNGNYGGGILNFSGTLTITDSTISDNTADSYGGGIYNFAGVVTITDCTVSGNISSYWYGAIENEDTMIIENSTITGNTATVYGGIENYGNMTITNSTIFSNISTGPFFGLNCGGAGLHNEKTITIQNSTIVDNTPSNISNGDDCNATFGGPFIINNSIVASTDPTSTNVNCVFSSYFLIPFDSSSTKNLSTDATCGDVFTQNTAAEINLGALTNNGGPTDTMALLTGSVAIDGGDDSSCPATDHRGVLRPQGTHCDIGAFELEQGSAQTINVTTHAPASAAYNTSFTVAATGGGSGNPVTYSSEGACTNVGATFTMTSGTGTCTVKYDQAGDGTYSPAPQVIESTTALKAGQAITVNTHAPAANAVYNTSFTVAATGGGSGNAVTYSSAGVCTNVGAAFTMTSGTGTCTVKYDQAGNDNYNAAPQVTETATAQRAGQTITVNQHAPASAAYNASFTVSATASSGLGVAITASGACSGSGTGSALITMSGLTDTCTVLFNQAGDANYNQAPQVSETTMQYVLTVATLGTGSGTVSGDGIVCNWDGTSATGSCSEGFTYNAGFNLSASADACSFLKEWGGNACSGTESECAGTMTVQQAVVATFDLYTLARLSSAMNGYDTIAEVYNNATGGVIQIQAHTFSEDLLLDLPIDFAIEGGWNCDYTQLNGVAGIKSLTVQSGSVTLQKGGLVIATYQ